jgi:four helix bundle protein
MPALSYRDLIAWKKAYGLSLVIYKITAHFPVDERYGLIYQLRKAAVSIPSNIAEGEGRKSSAEFCRFLAIALGSTKEIETQILLSGDLGYIDQNTVEQILSMASEVCRLINGLVRSLKSS